MRRIQRGRRRLPNVEPQSPPRQAIAQAAARRDAFQGRLIPISEAARRLKVHPTTLRRRAAREEVTIHRGALGLGLTEDALADAMRQPSRRGRPQGTAEANPAVIDQVLTLRGEGVGYAEIARRLNAAGVPPARGGRQWWASSVRSLCTSAQARRG